MHFGHDECSPTGLVIVINARWIKSRPETEHYQDWINSILHRLYCLWIIKQYPPCTPALSTMLCKLLLQTTSKSTILVNLEWLWTTNTIWPAWWPENDNVLVAVQIPSLEYSTPISQVEPDHQVCWTIKGLDLFFLSKGIKRKSKTTTPKFSRSKEQKERNTQCRHLVKSNWFASPNIRIWPNPVPISSGCTYLAFCVCSFPKRHHGKSVRASV